MIVQHVHHVKGVEAMSLETYEATEARPKRFFTRTIRVKNLAGDLMDLVLFSDEASALQLKEGKVA